jgi:hypothetical protein
MVIIVIWKFINFLRVKKVNLQTFKQTNQFTVKRVAGNGSFLFGSLVLILKDNGREHITMRERTMYVKI